MIYEEKINKNNVSKLLQELRLEKRYIDRVYCYRDAIAIDVNTDKKIYNRFDNVYICNESKYDESKHTLVYESIIDVKRSKLDPKVWTKDKKLKPKIKQVMLDDLQDMANNGIIDKEKITKLLLLGSIVTYNYTKDADLDVNVSIEMDDDELTIAKEALNTYNGKNAPGTTHPINYFFRTTPIELSDRPAYDIHTDEWLLDPDGEDTTIENFRIIVEEAISWCRKVDLDLGELRRDFIEYLMYEYLLGESNIKTEGIRDALSDKENEVKAGLDCLKQDLYAIKDLRARAFEGDDFDLLLKGTALVSPDYNTKNVIYKVIERYGYLDILHEAKEIHKKASEGKDVKNDLIKFLKVDQK